VLNITNSEHLLYIFQFISFTLNGECHTPSELWITCKFSVYYWIEVYGVVARAYIGYGYIQFLNVA
jgi:hypothetical protein